MRPSRATRVWFLVLPGIGTAQHRRPLGGVRPRQRRARPRPPMSSSWSAPSTPSAGDAPRAGRGRAAAAAKPGESAARLAIVAGAPRRVDPPAGSAAAASCAWLRRFHERIPTRGLDVHGRLRAGRGGRARRAARDHAPAVPGAPARAVPRRPRHRRGHLRRGRRRVDVSRHHARDRSGARAGRAGTTARRGDGRREAAGAVPAPLGQSGPVQPGAPPAGERAAQAVRHLARSSSSTSTRRCPSSASPPASG